MHIVLAEPSRVGRKILTQLLEQQGYSVVSFGNGLEAYNYIQYGGRADLLLTSFELPGMSGMELCWEVRLLAQENRQLYIIAMSSSMAAHKVIEALDCGADDFIHKPPLPEELFAKLRAVQRQVQLQQQLREMATHDSMTSLLNRSAFLDTSSNVLNNAFQDTPVSIIMLDIDHFKSVNDTYGHHAGDVAICKIASLIKRERDVVGRLGGEEFAIVLPTASDVEAVEYAEWLRGSIAGLTVEVDSHSFPLTASFGVTQWFNTPSDTITDMLKRADDALYSAKREGRNRVAAAAQDVCFMEA